MSEKRYTFGGGAVQDFHCVVQCVTPFDSFYDTLYKKHFQPNQNRFGLFISILNILKFILY